MSAPLSEPSYAERLLAVAPGLAERFKLNEISPRLVAEQAGLDEADFFACYPGFTGYVVRLQHDFLLRIRNELIERTLATAPGRERLRSGGHIFLDHCIAERGLREWFLHGRAQTFEVREGLRKMNQTYGLILAADFKTEGWPHPEAGARLFVALLQEISLIEHAARGPSADARTVLWEFLQTYN